jgi:hypothetical protein
MTTTTTTTTKTTATTKHPLMYRTPGQDLVVILPFTQSNY